MVGSQELGGARALLELLRSSVHKETVRASALNKDQKDVCALAHREVRVLFVAPRRRRRPLQMQKIHPTCSEDV